MRCSGMGMVVAHLLSRVVADKDAARWSFLPRCCGAADAAAAMTKFIRSSCMVEPKTNEFKLMISGQRKKLRQQLTTLIHHHEFHRQDAQSSRKGGVCEDSMGPSNLFRSDEGWWLQGAAQRQFGVCGSNAVHICVHVINNRATHRSQHLKLLHAGKLSSCTGHKPMPSTLAPTTTVIGTTKTTTSSLVRVKGMGCPQACTCSNQVDTGGLCTKISTV